MNAKVTMKSTTAIWLLIQHCFGDGYFQSTALCTRTDFNGQIIKKNIKY